MRFIIGALVAIGAFILIIVLIIKLVFGGGTPQHLLDLNSYADTANEVRLTINGPVNANKTHREVDITVGRDESTIDIIHGYQGSVAKRKTYDNNSASYSAFLHALTIAGYNRGDNNPKNRDESGQCAPGDRYVFSVLNTGGREIQHYWSTSCGGGTYQGATNQTIDLFQAQIPDYDDLTSDVEL